MINVKEYGIVSTDGDHVSVAAPTRDDYYPTMYEVKKEIKNSASQIDLSNYYTKQEIDGKGYLTSIPDNVVTEDELPEELIKGGSVLAVPQQVFDDLNVGTSTEEEIATAFGLTIEEFKKLFEQITVDGKYTSAVIAIGTDDNSRRYLPANLTVNKGEYSSFGITAIDNNFSYEQFAIVIGSDVNGIKVRNKVGNGYIAYPGIDIEDGSIEGSTFEGNIIPNSYYTFGEKTSITITGLNDGYSDRLDEYMFEFTSGDTPTILTVPETVRWVNEPNIEANKTYQVSILNNIGIIVGA